MLLHNLYISNYGVYPQELYMSERLDCKRIRVSQNRTTDDDCNCNRQLPECGKLHVSNWIHFIWDHVYIKHTFVLLMSKRRLDYSYGWFR